MFTVKQMSGTFARFPKTSSVTLERRDGMCLWASECCVLFFISWFHYDKKVMSEETDGTESCAPGVCAFDTRLIKHHAVGACLC